MEATLMVGVYDEDKLVAPSPLDRHYYHIEKLTDYLSYNRYLYLTFSIPFSESMNSVK